MGLGLGLNEELLDQLADGSDLLRVRVRVRVRLRLRVRDRVSGPPGNGMR